MGKRVKVTVGTDTREYDEGITYGEIAREYQKEYQYDIILAQKAGKLVELRKTVHKDCTVAFLTTATRSGHKTYERGAILLMLKAFYAIADSEKLQNVFIKHSLGDGVYCEADGIEVTEELLSCVEQYMKELVGKNLPFEKRSVDTSEALKIFEHYKMYDKKRLFESISTASFCFT